MTAAALILHCLATVRTTRTSLIIRYMDAAWNVPAGTTRNVLSALVREGKIERVARGCYRRRDERERPVH